MISRVKIYYLLQRVIIVIICNLGALLKARNITIADLREETHVPAATIRRMLDGSAHSIEFDVLEGICDYLECSVGDLLEHSA